MSSYDSDRLSHHVWRFLVLANPDKRGVVQVIVRRGKGSTACAACWAVGNNLAEAGRIDAGAGAGCCGDTRLTKDHSRRGI